MPQFGKKSLENLEHCHEDIKAILGVLIKQYDFSVISGIRTDEEQQELFAQGRSKLDGINRKSKHQGREDDEGNIVSFAVDIMPYAKGTNAFSGEEKDARRFYVMMGMVKAIARNLREQNIISHSVRFGMDWDGDDVYDDQTFDDLPHFELI